MAASASARIRSRFHVAIAASGRSEVELRRRMGAGYELLERAAAGEVLDKWEAAHVDHAVSVLVPILAHSTS